MAILVGVEAPKKSFVRQDNGFDVGVNENRHNQVENRDNFQRAE